MHGSGWQIMMIIICRASVNGLTNIMSFILSVNRHVLKRIKQSAEKSVSQTGGKDLEILIGYLVLLHDHLGRSE